VFSGHTLKVLHATFRPDGGRLVTSAADGTVRQWDTRTAREIEPPYDRHVSEVRVAVYSPDGQWIASGGSDRTVRLWRATALGEGRRDVALWHGHTGAIYDLAFVTVPGEARSGHAPAARVPGALRLPTRLLSASQAIRDDPGDGTVRAWDTASASLPILVGHTSYVYPVAYSPAPAPRWIASGSWDSKVRLWDAETGECCAVLEHSNRVRALAFSPDGTALISACDDEEKLFVWDTATGRLRGRIKGPGLSVWALAVSPDGTRIAVTNYDPATDLSWSVCDVATGEELAAGKGMLLAYSRNGRWLAGREADEKTIVVRDTRTYEPITRCVGHTQQVHSLAFSPDDQSLVSASSDSTVRLWDVHTGACRTTLEGHTDQVFTAVFHPDGRRLASAGRDRGIWIWDLATGQEVARLQGHTSYVWSLAFSPDGKSLVSGSGDTTVRLWDTAPLRDRHQARRAAEALRPEVERLLERLFREQTEAEKVVVALREDRSLPEPLRRAALREVLRRQVGPR